jgi:hypothetical protein
MKRTIYSEKECRKNESAGVAAPDTLRNTCHQQSIRQHERVQPSRANAKLFARRCGSPCTNLHDVCGQNVLFYPWVKNIVRPMQGSGVAQ